MSELVEQDELAAVIAAARAEWYAALPPGIPLNDAIAAAVRSFMGSDEAIDRAAEAAWEQESVRARGKPRLIEWGESGGPNQSKWRSTARAALSAALGPDIGGGRG